MASHPQSLRLACPSNRGYNGSGISNTSQSCWYGGFPIPTIRKKKLAIAAQTSDREMGVLTGPNPNSKQIDWTEVRAGRAVE